MDQDQSQPLAHTEIGERGEYTQIPSAEPVNLSKSEELSVPSKNKGEIEDTRKRRILGDSPSRGSLSVLST